MTRNGPTNTALLVARVAAVAVAAATAVLAVGCGGGDDEESSASTTIAAVTVPATETTVAPMTTVTTEPTMISTSTSTSTTVADETETVGVYLLVGESLRVVGRSVVASGPFQAVEALALGPTAEEAAAGFVTLLPEGTEVLGVDVSGNEATVNLSGAFASGGGSLSMMGRVAQVVYTVTQFAPIDTVRFRLDGVPITELGGEGIGVDGLTRLDITAVTPLILLETPLPGATVEQPVVIAGMSNTFEAGINYQVLALDRTVLLEGYTMATSGTGTWGTFEHAIEALPAGTTGEVIVRVFEYSPKDGEPVNIVEVVVEVA